MLRPMFLSAPCRARGWPVVISVLVGLLLGACAGRRPPAAKVPTGPAPHTFVFVGTAAGQILSFELDPGLGDLTFRSRQALPGPPAALAAHSTGQVLVAAIGKSGSMMSLSIDPATGALTPRGRASSRGQQAAFATLDGTGKYALVTHDDSASVAVVAIKTDGSLDGDGVDTFPAGKGAHGMALHPSNRVAFVANRRAGTLSQFSFNAGTGMLTPRPGDAGGLPWDSGPRQIACHPDGRFTYVLNEGNDTISAHAFDDRMGTLSRMAFQVISTLPPEAAAAEPTPAAGSRRRGRGKIAARPAAVKTRTGDLRISLDGTHLYATNNGRDTLVTFAIDPTAGTLTAIDHRPTGGEGAETLGLDPEGRYLLVANRGSHSLAVFRIDGEGPGDKRRTPLLVNQAQLPAAPVALTIARPTPAESPPERVPLPF